MVEKIRMYQAGHEVCVEFHGITTYGKCIWDALNSLANEIQRRTLRDPGFELDMDMRACFIDDSI